MMDMSYLLLLRLLYYMDGYHIWQEIEKWLTPFFTDIQMLYAHLARLDTALRTQQNKHVYFYSAVNITKDNTPRADSSVS